MVMLWRRQLSKLESYQAGKRAKLESMQALVSG
jgi:hypothetical protein